MSDELITYVIGQLRGACWEEEAAAVEALVKERDEYKDRIEELENSLAWYQMMDSMSSDHVVELTEKLEAAAAKLTKAVEALVAEREANLWNAYNIGIERDGRWSDACMSDAEWLVVQCGLDPEFKDHDANVIKETIPIAARAVLAELEGKE